MVKRLGFWTLSVIVGTFVVLAGGITEAKEMTRRLGVGFSNEYSINLPSIAAIYYPAPNYGITGALGIDTQSNNSSFAFQGGLRKILFTEENMNFHMGGILSLISQSIAGTTNSGFEIGALVGGEFFLPGLENLGFSFDTGVGVTNVSTVRFRTLGNSFLSAGMIFYF